MDLALQLGEERDMACDCSCERCGERPRTEVTRARRQKSSGWGVWKYVVGFLFGWLFFG